MSQEADLRRRLAQLEAKIEYTQASLECVHRKHRQDLEYLWREQGNLREGAILLRLRLIQLEQDP